MIKDNENAAKIADYLLQIKAVKLQPNKPFTWSSGWKSPIYCDNRKTLSYPQVRTFIRQSFCKLILDEYGKPDMIAGVATGGIAIGALVAEELGLPFIYVRSSSKGHGLENQVEGDASAGSSVVVIEDLISTGGSSLKAVHALKAAGLSVKGVSAIFTYDFQQSIDAFKEADCSLTTLTNYSVLLGKALQQDDVQQDDMNSLHEWGNSPETWNK